jgi:prepilin-type N-terminal cleavage/methylation domain-containing protein
MIHYDGVMTYHNPDTVKKMQSSKGFTLVELLVVIAIIVTLAAALIIGVRGAMLKAQKTQCLNTMRSVTTGLTAFTFEYGKPPIPESKALPGQEVDTIFGDPGGLYKNDYIVAVLEGTDRRFTFGGEVWDVARVNPKLETYTTFERSPMKKNGVYEVEGDANSGQLYDPWQKTILIAINVPPYAVDSADGLRDKLMHTWGLAEYADTKPREEQFIIWSYGKDGVKGTAGKAVNQNTYKGSDDVISW